MFAITRRTRWAQFFLLCLFIFLALAGWITWWCYDSPYSWWAQDLAVAGGLMVAFFLVWKCHRWLLAWEVEWDDGKT